MALVLGAEIGDLFFIGRRHIAVTSIGSPVHITIRRDDGKTFTIRDDQTTEVFSDVFIRTGPRQPARKPRLVFDAPQTIRIRRRATEDRELRNQPRRMQHSW